MTLAERAAAERAKLAKMTPLVKPTVTTVAPVPAPQPVLSKLSVEQIFEGWFSELYATCPSVSQLHPITHAKLKVPDLLRVLRENGHLLG